MSKLPETINVEHAFSPELRHAQADMDSYIEQNPYQDDKGNFHNPVTGDFISSEDAAGYYSYGTPEDFNLYELKDASELRIMADEAFKSGDVTTGLSILEEMSDRVNPEDISVTELARLSAWAEWRGNDSGNDKASAHRQEAFHGFMESVDIALLDKIDAIGMHDDYAERDGSLRDISNLNKDESLRNRGDHKSELDRYFDRLMKFRDDELKKLMAQDTSDKGDDAPVVLPSQTKEVGGDFGHRYDETKQDWVPHGPNLDSYMDSDYHATPVNSEPDGSDDDNKVDRVGGAIPLAATPVIASVSNSGGFDSNGTPSAPGALEDDRFAIYRDTDPGNKEKKSKKGKLAGAVLLLAGLIGAGILLANDEGPESNETPPAATTETDSDGTSPLDLEDAQNVFEEDAEAGSETEPTSPLDLSDAVDAFDEPAEDEVSGETDASQENDNQTLTIEDLVVDENAEPLQANEGNTAWDRAEAQGLDMNRFEEATEKTISLYNEYATAKDMAQLEYRDGNIWAVGTTQMINPAQYAIYAQIQQDVIAQMTGANPNIPTAELPEAK